MAAKFSIDLKSDPKVIAGTRTFDAPRALVFTAWTSPSILPQWWGPDGFSITTRSFDFRAGGVWRFVMHGPDGRDYENRITFDEIVRTGAHRLSPRWRRRRRAGAIPHARHFEDVDGGTRITMRGTFPSAAERDRVIKDYGADKGLEQTLGRLAAYTESMRKRDGTADPDRKARGRSHVAHALLSSRCRRSAGRF